MASSDSGRSDDEFTSSSDAEHGADAQTSPKITKVLKTFLNRCSGDLNNATQDMVNNYALYLEHMGPKGTQQGAGMWRFADKYKYHKITPYIRKNKKYDRMHAEYVASRNTRNTQLLQASFAEIRAAIGKQKKSLVTVEVATLFRVCKKDFHTTKKETIDNYATTLYVSKNAKSGQRHAYRIRHFAKNNPTLLVSKHILQNQKLIALHEPHVLPFFKACNEDFNAATKDSVEAYAQDLRADEEKWKQAIGLQNFASEHPEFRAAKIILENQTITDMYAAQLAISHKRVVDKFVGAMPHKFAIKSVDRNDGFGDDQPVRAETPLKDEGIAQSSADAGPAKKPPAERKSGRSGMIFGQMESEEGRKGRLFHRGPNAGKFFPDGEGGGGEQIDVIAVQKLFKKPSFKAAYNKDSDFVFVIVNTSGIEGDEKRNNERLKDEPTKFSSSYEKGPRRTRKSVVASAFTKRYADYTHIPANTLGRLYLDTQEFLTIDRKLSEFDMGIKPDIVNDLFVNAESYETEQDADDPTRKREYLSVIWTGKKFSRTKPIAEVDDPTAQPAGAVRTAAEATSSGRRVSKRLLIHDSSPSVGSQEAEERVVEGRLYLLDNPKFIANGDNRNDDMEVSAEDAQVLCNKFIKNLSSEGRDTYLETTRIGDRITREGFPPLVPLPRLRDRPGAAKPAEQESTSAPSTAVRPPTRIRRQPKKRRIDMGLPAADDMLLQESDSSQFVSPFQSAGDAATSHGTQAMSGLTVSANLELSSAMKGIIHNARTLGEIAASKASSAPASAVAALYSMVDFKFDEVEGWLRTEPAEEDLDAYVTIKIAFELIKTGKEKEDPDIQKPSQATYVALHQQNIEAFHAEREKLELCRTRPYFPWRQPPIMRRDFREGRGLPPAARQPSEEIDLLMYTYIESSDEAQITRSDEETSVASDDELDELDEVSLIPVEYGAASAGDDVEMKAAYEVIKREETLEGDERGAAVIGVGIEGSAAQDPLIKGRYARETLGLGTQSLQLMHEDHSSQPREGMLAPPVIVPSPLGSGTQTSSAGGLSAGPQSPIHLQPAQSPTAPQSPAGELTGVTSATARTSRSPSEELRPYIERPLSPLGPFEEYWASSRSTSKQTSVKSSSRGQTPTGQSNER